MLLHSKMRNPYHEHPIHDCRNLEVVIRNIEREFEQDWTRTPCHGLVPQDRSNLQSEIMSTRSDTCSHARHTELLG